MSAVARRLRTATVNGMPKMTDYVRQGFKRRRGPWHDTELPEWWNLVVWAALAGVVVSIGFGVLVDSGGTPTTADGGSSRYVIQTVNPYTASPAPADTAPTAPTMPTRGSDGPDTDFTATAAVQVPMTEGGGTAPVPIGARNLATAAARAMATGDWTGIPLAGTGTPSPAPTTPTGSLVGEVTVADPRVSGNSRYLFSASIRHEATAEPYEVRIAVERAGAGYAVRLR